MASLRTLLLTLVLTSLMASLVVFGLGCKKTAKPEPATLGEAPVLSDATTGFLLTWVDDKGEFHVEEKATDVPLMGRDAVRVVDPSKEAPEGDMIFVADLRNARPDGTYSVGLMKREVFEKLAVDRRMKTGKGVLAASSAAPSAGTPEAPSAASAPVIIYGASWCGPCHQAQAYLKRKGVPFVEKDVEEDRMAAREMQAKLTRAGINGGSIPVIDVRGKVLVGFDPGSVDRALAATAP